ncbi:hypothetical protein CS542_00850 [Pedobacter sp. IW39]|nr:hypothetical protein CS542_00850 [Pedobacter sp. IW39]
MFSDFPDGLPGFLHHHHGKQALNCLTNKTTCFLVYGLQPAPLPIIPIPDFRHWCKFISMALQGSF